MGAKTKAVEKESQKIGEGLGRAIGRVVEGYKPQEVSFYRTFFSDLLKSPRATRVAQLEREGAQNIYNAAKNAADKQLKEKTEFFGSLFGKDLKYARKNLSRTSYNEMRNAVNLAAEKEAKRFGEQASKELEGLPTWSGIIKNGTKNILNSSFTKYGMPIGAIGYGAYKSLFEDSPEEESSGSNYRWTPNSGWQHRDENGNWSDQQKEFGVDRFGNVNYYDGQNWVSDYIQDSDGTIYNRQGQVIGNTGDPIAMRASGYDNIFDYNAAQAGIQPDQVAAVQQALGVTPDGKWGARTQAAYQQVRNNLGLQYDPRNLFTIYQSRNILGY